MDVWGHPDFTFHKIDITRQDKVESIFEEYCLDGLIHLAAIVGDPACKLEPELARQTNLDASINLLELAKKHKMPRFIFASTCSNYGRMKDGDGFVDENSPLNPISLYAELKVAFEKTLLEDGDHRKGFAPTVLRFSTVFGLSPRMRFDLTVNEFTKELALGRELVVYGENYWRPYCHAGDFSNAILAVLRAPEETVAYNVFNVGDFSQNYTKKMLVEELLSQIPSARVRYVKVGEDPRDYRVVFDKIKTMLGFRIAKTVPEGMQEILSCIQQDLFANPDDPIYYNVPRS